jgi:hypothetical protein
MYTSPWYKSRLLAMSATTRPAPTKKKNASGAIPPYPLWQVQGSESRRTARPRGEAITRSEGPVSKLSYFLGDPPPYPRFLASLGALPSVTGYNTRRPERSEPRGVSGGLAPNERSIYFPITLAQLVSSAYEGPSEEDVAVRKAKLDGVDDQT